MSVAPAEPSDSHARGREKGTAGPASSDQRDSSQKVRVIFATLTLLVFGNQDFTCSHLDEHVDQVDDITNVVHDDPEDEVPVLQLPEDGARDDEHEVVHDGDRDDAEPAVIHVRRGVDRPRLQDSEGITRQT